MKERSSYFIRNLNRVLFGSLLFGVLALSACSVEPGDGPDPDPKDEESAYLSFSVGIEKSRAFTKNVDYGNDSENNVKAVRIALYEKINADTVVVESFDYAIQSGPGGTYTGSGLAPVSGSQPLNFKTLAQKLTKKEYLALAVINPDPVLSGFTSKGASYSILRTPVKHIGDDKTTDAGGMAETNNFPMTNVQGLVEIKLSAFGDSKNQAHNRAVPIIVGRVAAKVTVNKPSAGILVNGGASISGFKWGLDIVNKKSLYVRHMTGEEQQALKNGQSYARDSWYALDPNFSNGSGFTDTELKNHFFHYESISATPDLDYSLGGYEYCLENTMSLSEQEKDKVITRVLMHCKYKPANIAEDEGFYLLNGKVYSLDNMKAYNQMLENDGNTTDPVCQAIALAKGEGHSFDTEPAGSYECTVSKISYYHKGVNYYAVKILHFGTPGASTFVEGHYGVLRNTHYTVTVKQILGPGSPTIHSTGIKTRIVDSVDDSMMYGNISAEINWK